MDEIWTWINSYETDSANIFWLTGVAGSGKSAIAHTVSQRCFNERILLCSFFFSRDAPEKSKSGIFSSTLARDLAKVDPRLSAQIAAAIDDDPSLPSASISRQFEHLIRVPISQTNIGKSLVIVIDALDENGDDELLEHIPEELSKLPMHFRIFVTSRTTKSILPYFSNNTRIRTCNLNTYLKPDIPDILLYVRHRLKRIARDEGLEVDWPGEKLTIEFAQKAEGLFLWVETICNHLPLVMDPTKHLKMIVSNHALSGLEPERKMDETYAGILGTCNWEDRDFSHAYQLVFGTIMNAKDPMSISALQAFHRGVLEYPDVLKVLRQLSSLLIINFNETIGHPVKVLHQSFREFVTFRAKEKSTSQNYAICITEHRERLALQCLDISNKELVQCSEAGYLSNKTIRGIPVSEKLVTEHLWYSCRFWIDHVAEVEHPSVNLINKLVDFLSSRMEVWIELMASNGKFRNLSQLREWMKVCIVSQLHLLFKTANRRL